MRKPISKKLRLEVITKTNGQCGYCGIKADKLQIDHIKPVVQMGKNNIENLIAACGSCNHYKHSMSVDDFREQIGLLVARLNKHATIYQIAKRYGLIEEINKPVKFYFEVADEN